MHSPVDGWLGKGRIGRGRGVVVSLVKVHCASVFYDLIDKIIVLNVVFSDSLQTFTHLG